MVDDGREVRARGTLEGYGALITGSTAGIGAAVARTRAAAGARVVICGRDARRGEQVVEQIAQAGGQAVFVPADLTDLEQVRGAAHAAEQLVGHVDVLVNNAGSTRSVRPTRCPTRTSTACLRLTSAPRTP